MPTRIKHIIVLMLENRSFDHMLGFMNHPTYPNLKVGDHPNPDPGGGPAVGVDKRAHPALPVGPDHKHDAVMEQLLGEGGRQRHGYFTKPYKPTNDGFLTDYTKRITAKKGDPADAPRIMECFDETLVPVLTTLAKEFAVCTNWFCSVPGQTWPNRNYAHAATSHGEVNIKKKFYFDRTIFQELKKANRSWAIFHKGLAQAMVFPKLWDLPWRNHFKGMKKLYKAIRKDKLPNYSFVEPDHGMLLRKYLKKSNSQHPDANRKGVRDFVAGETLIAKIYNALKDNPEVFDKTLFVIIYDEHGGFFDHVAPPTDAVAPDKHVPGRGTNFNFDMLGSRVPAVLVSPLIPKATVDDTTYDHSSIIKTVRKVLTDGKGHLTARDDNAESFEGNVSLSSPRIDLPNLAPLTDERAEQIAAGLRTDTGGEPDPVLAAFNAEVKEEPDHVSAAMAKLETLNTFDDSLVALAANVEKRLGEETVDAGLMVNPEWSDAAAEAVYSRCQCDQDLSNYVDGVCHQFGVQSIDPDSFELRTCAGDTFERPNADMCRAEVRNLKAMVRDLDVMEQAKAFCRLNDARDRSVTIFGDCTVQYYDLETGEEHNTKLAN